MLKNYKLLFKNGEKLDLAGLSEKERKNISARLHRGFRFKR